MRNGTEFIGPYRLLEAVGEGGMGIVYRARHTGSDRAVALKTARAPAVTRLAGIRREIQALKRIRHPGIVRILDHGVHEGFPWYTMDLLEGESLRQMSRRLWSAYQPAYPLSPTVDCAEELVSETEELSPADGVVALRPLRRTRRDGQAPAAAGQLGHALKLMRRVSETLAYLHGEGIANGDLKPDNILVVAGEPVLIDFGLAARHPSSDGRETLAERGARWGTLPYMSPEQARGELADARSDLYSLGCMLFELLVGSPPFTGSPRAVLHQHLHAAPVRPSELVGGLDPELEHLVLKLLGKDPGQRFGYADEVAALLAKHAHDVPRLVSYPPAAPYLYRPAFVGRQSILAELTEKLEQASRGRGALVLLGGESGVGKTRLALELMRVAAASQLQLVTGETPLGADGAPQLGHGPLLALRPLLQAVADRCLEAGPAATEALLGERRAVLAQYEPSLAQVPAHEPLAACVPVAAAVARDRLFRYLAETLRALARQRPLLLMLDDVGGADELSSAFLQSLSAEFLESTPLLILGTYRSEDTSEALLGLLRAPHTSRFELPRLDGSAVRSLVRDTLAMPEPPPAFVRAVEQETEGNPFFVAEFLRAAVNERLLFRAQGGSWRVASSLADGAPGGRLPLPRSVRELVARRLRRLSTQAQHTALAAAVLGREVEVTLLAEVAELSDAAAMTVLDELLRASILSETDGFGAGEAHEPAPPEHRLRFSHDKLREVSHELAPDPVKRALHLRAARVIEARVQKESFPARHWATLGHHFAAACEPASAAHYLQLAGEHARGTFANADAIALFREALRQVEQLLSGPDEARWQQARVELCESLGDVLALVGRRHDARRSFEACLEHAPASDAARRSRVLRKEGKTWETEHEHEKALSRYQLAQQAAGPDPASMSAAEREAWLHAHIEQVWVFYWLNRVTEMDQLITRIRPLVERHGSPELEAHFFQSQIKMNLRRERYVVSDQTLALARGALLACRAASSKEELPSAQFNYGFALLFHRSLGDASHELRAALELAERAGDSAQQARCLTYLALATRQSGLVKETRAYAERLVGCALEAGMRDYVGAALAHRAWVELRSGQTALAEVSARQALDTWAALTTYVYPFRWLALVPLIELAATRCDVAVATRFARGLAEAGQQAIEPAALDGFAEVERLWALGRAEAAQSALWQGLGRLREQGFC